MSLHTPGSPEDVFPYYNPKAKWKELKSIRVPLAVVIDSKDEYLDRPVREFIDIFRQNAVKTKSFTGVILKGAGHSFTGKEKELAQTLIRWVKRAVV